MIDEKVLLERLEKEMLQSIEAKAEAIIGMCGVSANVYCGEVYAYEKAIEIVKDLAEEHKHDMVTQLAMMYAKNIYVYGVDATKAWESAVQNHMALEKAYIRGRQDESDKFARWQDEHNNGFCEWEIVSDKDIHREYKPMCSEDGFIEITGYFDYEFCPYCGKKIKVLEKQKDTWKQNTMSRFERVE